MDDFFLEKQENRKYIEVPLMQDLPENNMLKEIFRKLKSGVIKFVEALDMGCEGCKQSSKTSLDVEKCKIIIQVKNYWIFGLNNKIRQNFVNQKIDVFYPKNLDVNLLSKNKELYKDLAPHEVNMLNDFLMLVKKMYDLNKDEFKKIENQMSKK